ncbi:MAG: quinol:cytochrome C oxidoreductase [Planctomycetota bacterium]
MSAQHSKALPDLGGVLAPKFEAQRKLALIVAVVGLVGAGAMAGITGNMRLLQFSWLYGCMYFLTLGLGALFFVQLQHLTRAGWSVVVRRIAEHVASALPVVALLLAPLVIATLMGNGDLFKWANLDLIRNDPDESISGTLHLYEHKAPYLNGTFFLVRFAIYVVVWFGLVRFFRTRSLQQDVDGDPMHTVKMVRIAAPGMFLFALSLTFAAFDFMMSLDAPWFSTIWGVYTFAGAFMSFMSLLGLLALRSESKGYLRGLVTPEHYHDIGKLMFAFVFFWSYIAFSQFVLQWYADIPEETLWYKHRMEGGWANLSWVLLFGHIFIPFLGLLSRHVKRNRAGLRFWACWLLCIQAVDLYWVIMPNYDHHMHLPVMELFCLLAVGGVFAFVALGSAAGRNLTPVKDPRLPESLAFTNI